VAPDRPSTVLAIYNLRRALEIPADSDDIDHLKASGSRGHSSTTTPRKDASDSVLKKRSPATAKFASKKPENLSYRVPTYLEKADRMDICRDHTLVSTS